MLQGFRFPGDAGIDQGQKPYLAALITFGALLVTAVNGMVSIDRKRRHALGRLWDEFAAQTSRLPFAAILVGRTRFEISEFRAWQVALAGRKTSHAAA
jgi:uncharacterized membrane protein